MPGVHIVTDSSCDLTSDDLDQLNVEVVPLSIRFGNKEFTDGLDLSVADFYSRMAREDELPQTACPSPGAFEQAFRRASDSGADSVVCLNISGGLSNTVQSAKAASNAVAEQIPVHVVDSKSVSSGLGTLVLEAARLARGCRCRSRVGADPIAHSEDRVFAALNTLENLKKGGRIGGAKAMLGSILSIKPLVDISTGQVQEAGKPRTRKKAMQMLYERMIEAGSIEHVAVMHGVHLTSTTSRSHRPPVSADIASRGATRRCHRYSRWCSNHRGQLDRRGLARSAKRVP